MSTSGRDDESLDALLMDAAPPTTVITEPVEDELARMSVMARHGSSHARGHSRRGSRMLALGLAGAVFLGGAGAAAAATLVDWGPWGDADPGEYILPFAVPSGAQCLMSIVFVRAPDPEVAAALESYLGGPDINSDLDVPAEIALLRADMDSWWINPNGSKEPAWYGTERYPRPDEEYKTALGRAVGVALTAELRSQGFSDDELEAKGSYSWGYGSTCRKASS